MKKFLVLIATAAALCFAESAPQTHDGFFMNWTLGLGYQSFDYVAADNDYYDMKAGGLSAETDFFIGGRIIENTLLHASFIIVKNTNDIDRYKNGRKYDETQGISEQMNLFGLGATYYLPSNIFFTASVGLTWFSIEVDNCSGNYCTAGSTETGFGFQVGAGKEWWVAPEWGIGAKLAFTYGSAEDKDAAGDASGFGINLMFTVTYN